MQKIKYRNMRIEVYHIFPVSTDLLCFGFYTLILPTDVKLQLCNGGTVREILVCHYCETGGEEYCGQRRGLTPYFMPPSVLMLQFLACIMWKCFKINPMTPPPPPNFKRLLFWAGTNKKWWLRGLFGFVLCTNRSAKFIFVSSTFFAGPERINRLFQKWCNPWTALNHGERGGKYWMLVSYEASFV